MRYVFDLHVEDFLELITQMIKEEAKDNRKDIEDKLYFRWVYEMPYVEEHISFEQYKKKAIQQIKKKTTPLATEEDNIKLIEKYEKIRQIHQGR